jgi:Tfp pilus assembly protein PilX
MKLRQPLTVMNNEKGMVLVVAMMLIAVLTLLGSTSTLVTNSDMKISSNYKVGTEAFYVAEAGLEAARDQLRTNMGTYTVSQLLAARVGANGVLSESTSISNFYANGVFVTDDTPYIANTTFGTGTYRVYMTNDLTDGVTSTADINNQVILTSFGQGADNSLAIIQEVVQKPTVPPMPGAIVLPGPDVLFQGGNSNASSVVGGVESAVSLTSAAAEATVENNLTSIGRINNYTCNAGSGGTCINNESAFPASLTTVAGIETLASLYQAAADSILTGPVTLTAAQVGTTADSKIVIVNGAATLGPVNGAGILVVTGQLTLSGNFNYTGLIMCIGQGKLLRDGGGNGDINGAIFVAKTRDASDATLTTLGIPDFNTNGGGNSDITYDPNAINNAGGVKFIKKSWKQI